MLSDVSVPQVQQIEEFVRKWIDAKRRTAAPKTWANINSAINIFLEWLDGRRKGPMTDLTAAVVADFRDAELATGKAPTTINKELSFLAQLFDEAVGQGALATNPARGLRIKGAKKKAQRRLHFTFDQFRALVERTAPGQKGTRGAETHPDWQTFIITTGYTGGRQQEVAKLKWEQVDFENGRIGLIRTKSGSDLHVIPMHPFLCQHLAARALATPGHKPTDFVMPGFAAMEQRYLSKTFRELILPRIGIRQPYRDRQDQAQKGRQLAQYSIHSLRHSLSTWLNDAGVPEIMRMRIVGHEDEDVSRGYTHTEIESYRRELAKLPSL